MDQLTEQPLVSVVTPSFNSVDFIERTLDSVAGQEYPRIEHIVIDGGSTDGTRALLKQRQDITVIAEPDEGQADALNKGFRIARGTIIGWLNSDDTYEPYAVGNAVTQFKANPSAGIVFGHCNFIDEQDHVLYRHDATPFDLSRCLTDYRLPQPSAFISSEAVANAGPLNADLQYVMDWDLFVRIGLRFEVVNVDQTWANFRLHAVSKTVSQPVRFWYEAIDMFDRLFDTAGTAERLGASRDKAYARAYWMIGLIEGVDREAEAQSACRAYCRKALETYPLLTQDAKWVNERITHQAVTQVEHDNREAYVVGLFDDVGLTDGARTQAQRQALGHLHAALYLIQGRDEAERYGVTERYGLSNAVSAIRNDPRWLLNRGMLSRLLRDFDGRLRQVDRQDDV